MALQADGRILVAATITLAGEADGRFAVLRFDRNGDLDPSFGEGGTVYTSFPGYSSATAYGIAVGPDGRIVVVGLVSRLGIESAVDFGLARYEADGAPDIGFGGDGTVTTSFGPAEAIATSVALQADGRIVVAGMASPAGGPGAFALARYVHDGGLDPSFGLDGRIVTRIGQSGSAGDVLLQADGRIVAAGGATTHHDVSDFAVARYQTDGRLDPSFGNDGIATGGTNAAPGLDRGLAVAIQPDGRIVAAGSTGPLFGLSRYAPDGTLDPTWGGDGTVTTLFGIGEGGADADAFAVELQADGKIVAAGTEYSDVYPAFGLARYRPDGSLDAGFGGDGLVVTAIGGGAHGRGLAIQADGRIVVVGYSYRLYGGSDVTLARYTAHGRLDFSFGMDGIITTDLGSSEDQGFDLVLQADGRILVAGRIRRSGDSDFMVARYRPDGTLDPTFGSGGIVTTDVSGGGADAAFALTLQPDGRIVVAGMSEGNFALARYEADGSLDSTFGKAGTAVTDIDGGEDRVYGVALDLNGRIVVAGSARRASGDLDFGLARYRRDGSLDAEFGEGGTVTTDFDYPLGGTTYEGARGVVVQTDGRIVVVGTASANGDSNFALARYLGSRWPGPNLRWVALCSGHPYPVQQTVESVKQTVETALPGCLAMVRSGEILTVCPGPPSFG